MGTNGRRETDKGATAAAVGCLGVGQPQCATAATVVAVSAKAVGYSVSPPGAREFSLDMVGLTAGSAIDSISRARPMIWFTLQTVVTSTAEFVNPYLKRADEQAAKP